MRIRVKTIAHPDFYEEDLEIKNMFKEELLMDTMLQTSKFEDHDVVAGIIWSVGDIKSALQTNGMKTSDENIQKVIDSRFRKNLEERSIEEGWEIISCIIDTTEGLESVNILTKLDA